MNIFDLFKSIETPAARAPVDFLVVGLGNPGAAYEGTRHNAGFLAADHLATTLGVSVNRAKFHALYAEVTIGQRRGLLLKPQTFMNLSGTAVAEAAGFYKIPPEQILVLHDEISFAPGLFRIRRGGSAGGHNGLKSIIAALGSEAFPRIKIGVGQKPAGNYDLADWVLGKLPAPDKAAIEARLSDVDASVRLILAGDIEQAMSLYSK